MEGNMPAVESGGAAAGTGPTGGDSGRRPEYCPPNSCAGADVVTNMSQIMTDAMRRVKRECMVTSEESGLAGFERLAHEIANAVELPAFEPNWAMCGFPPPRWPSAAPPALPARQP
jgi:hypothetical protein